MFCEQAVFCIVFKPSYESSMTKDIRVLKRKKIVWNIFPNILQEMCIIFFYSLSRYDNRE